MSFVTVEEAQTRLAELIAQMKPGEQVLITDHDRPVARLIAESTRGRRPRKPGSAVGQLAILQEDDAHLEDFKDYMP